MNNINDKKIIKEMYKSINTPEYDVSKDVLNAIHQKPQKKYINKRVLVLAAIICSVFLLLGTAAASGILTNWKTFDFFGNTTLHTSEPKITPTPSIPPSGETPNNNNSSLPIYSFTETQNISISQFQDECKPGEIRVAIGKGGGGVKIGSIEFDDISKLKKYLQNSNTKLPLPEYIPNHYSLESGRIRFYVDDENMVELVSSKVHNDITYNIYKLADGFEKNIESVYLKYSNAEGNYLTYEACLIHTLSENSSFEIGAPESAVSKTINITGFENSILIHDSQRANVTLNTLALYKEIPTVEAIQILSKIMHQINGEPTSITEDFYDDILDAMLCQISADDLNQNEVIKIAESIQ